MQASIRAALAALATAVVACSGPTEAVSEERGGASEQRVGERPRPVLDAYGPELVRLGEVGPVVTFDVPAGTLGFSLDASEADVVSLTAPDGTPYVTDNVVRGRHIVAGRPSVPSTSVTMALPTGTWQLTLSRSSTVSIARQRTGDGRFHGGVLDLFVYLPRGIHAEDYTGGVVPGAIVDAKSAPTNPVIQAKLDAFFDLAHALLDLDRGSVSFFDTEARFLSVPASGDDAAFSVGSASAKGGPGLHVLFTETFGDEKLRGLAPLGGGAFPGGRENTVAVDMTEAGAGIDAARLRAAGISSADAFAATLLHEAGHLWGLSHTTELDGGDSDDDDLGDTPHCAPTLRAADVTTCPDFKNLMFPMTPRSGATLTPQQLSVLRGVAAYRPYAP